MEAERFKIMNLLLIGSGGHAGVIVDAAQQAGFKVVGLLDDFATPGTIKHGVPIIGKVDDGAVQHHFVFIAVGDNAGRFEVFKKVNTYCPRIVSIVHPKAVVAPTANIMPGCFIGAGAVIGNESTVGMFSIVNTNASLDHDSKLGEFSHLAPNSATGGHVTIGNNCLIGVGASVRDKISIGNNCTVGMGSCVVKNIPDGSLEYGNPSKGR